MALQEVFKRVKNIMDGNYWNLIAAKDRALQAEMGAITSASIFDFDEMQARLELKEQIDNMAEEAGRRFSQFGKFLEHNPAGYLFATRVYECADEACYKNGQPYEETFGMLCGYLMMP